MKLNPLIGKTIRAIHLASDKLAIRFDIEGGEPVVARCDADCCSHTWVESIDLPEAILDSPVVSVDDVEMPDLGGSPEFAYYGCRIATAKGSCVIDYRNESNGYYGGWLEWPSARGNQNVSSNDWELVAGTPS